MEPNLIDKATFILKLYRHIILNALSGILLPLGTGLAIKSGLNIYNSLICFSGLIFFVFGNALEIGRTKDFDENKKLLQQTQSKLKRIISRYQNNYKDAFDTLYKILQIYLANIVEQEMKGIITNDERITVYSHDIERKCFRQIGRFSPDSIYKRKSSIRKEYPEQQGSIGDAWRKGECEITIPDFYKDEDEYRRVLIDDYGFKNKTIDHITMRSRYFRGYAIENNKKNKIGVILFESLQIKRLKTNEKKLEEIALDKHNVIQTMIEKENELRNMFPFQKLI